MAVDVEAEVSATKRSQVEVTKILPEWTEEERQDHQTQLSLVLSNTIALYSEVFVLEMGWTK